MRKPKKRPTARKLHDLACSNCGTVNINESDVESTTAFCPACQENTQHYSISSGPADVPKKSGQKKKSIYSPGKKKMGF